MSERAIVQACEQTNKRSGARKSSEQCGASNQMSGASERANGRASGPVLIPGCSGPLFDGLPQVVDSNNFRPIAFYNGSSSLKTKYSFNIL